MIKRICDPVVGVVPSVKRICQDVDRVILALFAIIEKKGCVVHGLTPRTGRRWIAAQHGVGPEITNLTRNKGGARVKSYYQKLIPLHEDAMEVERQMILSFSNTRAVSVPALNGPVQNEEDIDDARSTMPADADVVLAMGENDNTSDAMQVETQLVASFVSNNPVPAAIVPVEHVEGIDDTASVISADASVDLALGDNTNTYNL